MRSDYRNILPNARLTGGCRMTAGHELPVGRPGLLAYGGLCIASDGSEQAYSKQRRYQGGTNAAAGGEPRPHCASDTSQPGTPVMSGSLWAMPLWQSMQVRSPDASNVPCMFAARPLWRVKSIDSKLWQLRHSRLSLALSRAHSCSASSRRWAANFSDVLMVPKILPQTSFEAASCARSYGSTHAARGSRDRRRARRSGW